MNFLSVTQKTFHSSGLSYQRERFGSFGNKTKCSLFPIQKNALGNLRFQSHQRLQNSKKPFNCTHFDQFFAIPLYLARGQTSLTQTANKLYFTRFVRFYSNDFQRSSVEYLKKHEDENNKNSNSNQREESPNKRSIWNLLAVVILPTVTAAIVYCNGSPDLDNLWKILELMGLPTKKHELNGESVDEEEGLTTPEVTAPNMVEVDSLKEWIDLLLPESLWFAIAVAASFASSMLSLYIPKMMGNMIDIIKAVRSSGELSPIPNFDFKFPAMIFLGIVLAQTGLNFVFNYVLSIAGDNIATRLRKRLFAKLLQKDIAYFDKTSTGELISGVSSDVSEVKAAVKHTLSMGTRSLTQIVGGMISLFLISPRLTTMMVLIMPSLVLIGTFYSRIIQRMSRQVQDALAKATAVAEESISNIRTVRAFTSEEKESERYALVLDNHRQLSSKVGTAVGLFHSFYNICINGGFMLVMLLGSKLVVDGQMTGGALTSYIMYSLTLQSSLVNLSILQGELVKGLGAASRIFESINEIPVIPVSGGAQLTDVLGKIEFRDVTFRYPTRPNVRVLKKLNLKLEEGKRYAIVGPSGSGKSTLAWLIERFYDPESGEVLIDNEDIRKIDPKSLRQHISIVSQEPVLFATSIFENIRFGKPDASLEEVVKAAKLANADGFISNFPHTYNTVVGERGLQLSGGQKQRIAIARAILKNAKILILDEATSALDAESEHLVQEALQVLMKDKTVVMIAHRLSTIQSANQIFVMKNGRIVESGTHQQLMKKKGVYSHLVAKQMH